MSCEIFTRLNAMWDWLLSVQAFPPRRLACNNFRTTTQDVKQALVLHIDKQKRTVYGILAAGSVRFYIKYTSMFEYLT